MAEGVRADGTVRHQPGTGGTGPGSEVTMAYNQRECLQCGADITLRKSTAQFCSKRHARADPDGKRHSYDEPPLPGTPSVVAETQADARFRAAVAGHEKASQPLTDEERILLDRQRRNPGPMLPELQKRLLDREYERRRAEAAELAAATIRCG